MPITSLIVLLLFAGQGARPLSDRAAAEAATQAYREAWLSNDSHRIMAARDVIARRFRDNLSLSDIAREVESSVFYLARVFKARTGFSLHTYRNQLRLRAALERLRDRDVDLIDIAIDLGFSSHSHFTETFRRYFGGTPSLIRETL